MSIPGASAQPFRWDLITPDQLGNLLRDTAEPDLWFAPPLAECTGRVLARSGGGDLFFVGRSLDSMFDLLGGALAEISQRPTLARLPFSFAGRSVQTDRAWNQPLSERELAQARTILTSLELTPQHLARRRRPATLVDVVYEGFTFTHLFSLLRDWVDEEREPWNVIRRRLRFVGVTIREQTSPNTFRWQQAADWTRQLPASSVLNVSLDERVWFYLGNGQVKLTIAPDRWLADAQGPRRSARTKQALAEAVGLVRFGRSREGRALIAQAIAKEPTLSQPWLRLLHRQLSVSSP